MRAGKSAPVPLALRNASFKGAAAQGYGEGYRYAHDYEEGIAPMQFMPEGLEGTRYYEPTTRGYEANITPRLAHNREVLDREN